MLVRHPEFDLEHSVPHWGDNAAGYLFEVDRAAMTEEEVAAYS